jgi:bifunctional non-homologous end joining protein LigD
VSVTSATGTTAAQYGGVPRFVVQEHHASSLHWDLRLERDGVAVSWAVPKGVSDERGVRRLAVHVEDHSVEHMSHSSPRVIIWDEGTYESEKWEDDKIVVELHGKRLDGRYALIRTDGDNWLIHRTR